MKFNLHLCCKKFAHKHMVMISFFIAVSHLVFINGNAQTNYSPLYTSANFTKTIDLNRPVGTVSGTAGTTPSGGATYSIPIYTPPGTNGMQPSVSISYNSQGGAGVVGYGWSIAGLSVISWGGKDLFHDGVVAPVEFNYESPFLLDGMRLNPIQGDNGGDGTIYAGESESFARVVSHRGMAPFQIQIGLLLLPKTEHKCILAIRMIQE